MGAPRFRLPSLGWRITVASLRLIPLVILWLGLPVAVLTYLGSHSIALPISIVTASAFGIAVIMLSTARYVARPTRYYGPLAVAAGAAVIGYLVYLWTLSPYSIAIPHSGATISLGFGTLVLLFLLVPALAVAAALVTTVEDARHPAERYPFDFPP